MGQVITPTVRNILAACIGMFLLQIVMGDRLDALALWPPSDNPFENTFEPWQLVSYAFLHGGYAHLFFNMFALYMFGPDIERLLGPRRFLTYYLVCVIGAALAQLAVLRALGNPSTPTVGASGGIFGLLLAFGLAFPRRRLMLLFPPIPMPAWLFITLYGLLELYLGVSGHDSGVAHFAHLGGMVGGFALILYWRAQQRR
ncbi:MAG TPA: rhomboid family intramembrane serine protease [Steroidobacteraceae bacterium]|nr:rhomboid family intramembrane serine protease [Steroidobacteraceae bacterium]